MAREKSKKINLNWQGGILDTSDDLPVAIKTKDKIQTKVTTEPKKIEGRVCIRLEKKGRAGKPVLILYQFSSVNGKNKECLKNLCSLLQTKFACGGSVDNYEILLMTRDEDKLKKVLKEDFSLIVH